MNGAPKTQAAAPGWTAASDAVRPNESENAPGRNAVFSVASKDSKPLPISQLSLFDDQGNPTADTNEMALFFDSVRPHLEGLKASDRLSVLACIYWRKTGEDRETLAALLRKPLRPVFTSICELIKL